MLLAVSCGIAVFLYALFLSYIYSEWRSYSPSHDSPTKKMYSIVLPMRDEASTIAQTIQSILEQSYQGFEIIVVDDHSLDASLSIVSEISHPKLKVIELPKGVEGKKRAIEYGVNEASYDHVVTLDADCLVGDQWLTTYNEYPSDHCLVGPVSMNAVESSWFNDLQMFDWMAMQGFMAAGIKSQHFYMASGANWVYPSRWFHQVGGFSANQHIASGDDMFLLEAFRQKYPSKIAFIKDKRAIVRTETEETIPQFYQQRVRWSSKMKAMQGHRMLFVLGAIWLLNVLLLGLLITSVSYHELILVALMCSCVKWIVDYIYLYKINKFYSLPFSVYRYVRIVIPHMIYIIAMGFLQIVRPRIAWKGREIQLS